MGCLVSFGMTKINILCLTLILLLVVECHLRETQLSSVSSADGEKDEANDILNANLDKLIESMTISKTAKDPVDITGVIVSIATVRKLFEMDRRIGQLQSEISKLEFHFLTTKSDVFELKKDLRLQVQVPLDTLESKISFWKGGSERLQALNDSCKEYDTDTLFDNYIEAFPNLVALEMKEANYAKDAWDANLGTIEGISKQLARVYGLCQVVTHGIPDASLNKTIHDNAFTWGSQIDKLIKEILEKMKVRITGHQ
uniref:Uncharacterized protein n=1 Tax=Panagrolaimus sp. PS1159 TaxID=55785 RepID=A0AC35FAB4_9BILA